MRKKIKFSSLEKKKLKGFNGNNYIQRKPKYRRI